MEDEHEQNEALDLDENLIPDKLYIIMT